MKWIKGSICVLLSILMLTAGKAAIKAEEVETPEITLSENEDDYRLELKEEITSYTYTGSEIKPEVSLIYTDNTDPENPVEHEVDESIYEVIYSNNINAGNATVTAVFTVNANEITAETHFSIASKSISSAKLTTSKTTYYYTGKTISPAVSVMLGTKKLVKGTDYTVSYTANKEVGKATITVTGKGNYKGTVKKYFNIKPATPKLSYVTKYEKNTLKWKKITGATGYIIYRSTSKNGTYKKCKAVTSLSYSEEVKFDSVYYYKIRAYRTVKSKNYYGDYSTPIKVQNRLKIVTIYSCDRMTETSINISFERIPEADGYYIYRSTKENGTYTKIARYTTTRRWAYLDENCKSGTRYYYKVVAYTRIKGKTYTSRISLPFKAELWKESVMYYLFPDGVPKTERAMSKYLTDVRVVMVDANGHKSYRYLTVHKKLAKKFKAAFQDMADAGIPVRRSDTGTYNWRSMTTSNQMSHHSYGVVVDLNYNSNPFVRVGADAYAMGYRPGKDPYSVTKKVVKIWAKYGFDWGGGWPTYKDYMHFSFTGH